MSRPPRLDPASWSRCVSGLARMAVRLRRRRSAAPSAFFAIRGTLLAAERCESMAPKKNSTGLAARPGRGASKTTRRGGTAMSETKQRFSASLAKDAVYRPGLRSFMEYRDLGIEAATHGRFRAHVIRIKPDAAGDHDLHTTGLHRHLCDFQMFYVLKGWIRFVY